MGIDKIKSNGLNKIHQIKQEQTKENKPKDTEFQGEKGRDLLGVQGDARSVLIGKINTTPKVSTEQNRTQYPPLTVAEMKAKYGDRFNKTLSEVYQEYPEVITKLLDQKNENGEYLFDTNDGYFRYHVEEFKKKTAKNEKIIKYIKSENYSGEKLEDISLSLQYSQELTPEIIHFTSKADILMRKNIFYTTPKDFISNTLKQIKPEEQESFIKWLEFCNKKAEEADEPNWFDDSNNDKKNVVQNMTFFVENSEIRKAPEKYIELMNYLPEDVSLQDKIYAIFEKGEITAEEIDDNIEAQKLVNEDKSLNGENILNSLYNERFYEKEDKAIYQNITAKNFIELYKKLHSIQNKIGLTTTDYVNILSNPDLTDEMIKNTTDLIKEQKEIKPPLKEITLATLSYGDPESYSHYSKWLNIIAENFNEDLGLYNKLDYVINTVSNYIASETDAEVKLVESLVQSDILDAIKSGELSVGNINIEHIERTEEELIKREDIEDETDFEKIIQYQKQEKQKLAKSLLDLIPKAYVIEEILKKNQITKEILYNNSKSGIFELIDKVKKLKDKVLENSDNYVNGDDLDEYSATAQVSYFFKNYQIPMIRYMQIADKETLDVLLRKRFDDAGEYLQAFGQLSSENRQLLKEMSESTNISGKPFMPTQKIEFIDLLNAYQNSNISTDKIKEMINKGKIDIAELNIDLFREIMKSTGLTDEEIATIPTEKLVSWDMKYAHLLAKGIDESDEEDNEAFNDVIKAATLSNFGEYIEDESNIYGQTNKKTEAIFQEMGLDYKNWKTPPKDLEIHFVAQDSNTEQLTQIVSQITEDMNTLMQTPVKGFLKKQFPKCIKGDSFVIPHEIANNKNELIKFVTILTDTTDQGQLTQVWKRAQGNINNPDPNRVASAKNTLTILDHLNQRLDDLSKIKDLEQVDENGKKIKAKTQNLDLTIKMWDRIPQKDIFQGNYSTCCIGMGGGNEGAMPHYLLDTAFNMIEFVDNNTRETMGNALCFFIKDEKGEPAFIIDNIEYKNNAKPSDEVGLKLRDAITQYAQNVARTVTGKDTTSIYIGGNYNDVPDKDLESHKENISFLGEIDCSSIYLDLYNGWTNKDELKSNVKLWKLK